MITAIGPRECVGCGELVNAWLVNGVLIVRERFVSHGPIHVCADPDRRERVDMTLQQYRLCCPDCGSRDVAYSTWGRLMDFPMDCIWAEGWIGALTEHVCNTQATATQQAKSARFLGVNVPEL